MNHITQIALGFLMLILAGCQPAALPTPEAPTVTPEVYIPLEKAIPEYAIALEGVHLKIARTILSGEFPAGCTGAAPGCTQAKASSQILSVTLAPRDLPEGSMLAYKNLPDVRLATGCSCEAGVPVSLTLYSNADDNLTIGFEVPADASTFWLKWADLAAIQLNAEAQ